MSAYILAPADLVGVAHVLSGCCLVRGLLRIEACCMRPAFVHPCHLRGFCASSADVWPMEWVWRASLVRRAVSEVLRGSDTNPGSDANPIVPGCVWCTVVRTVALSSFSQSPTVVYHTQTSGSLQP